MKQFMTSAVDGSSILYMFRPQLIKSSTSHILMHSDHMFMSHMRKDV